LNFLQAIFNGYTSQRSLRNSERRGRILGRNRPKSRGCPMGASAHLSHCQSRRDCQERHRRAQICSFCVSRTLFPVFQTLQIARRNPSLGSTPNFSATPCGRGVTGGVLRHAANHD
jgi:hypothetical protein